MCCKPVKKKKRRRKKSRHRRQDPQPEPVENAVYLDDEAAENQFAQESFTVDRPVHNVIEPIPMAQPVPSISKHVDSITYSAPEPLPLILPPLPVQIPQDIVEEERPVEENRQVVHHYPSIAEPAPAQNIVPQRDDYPVRKFSEEKQEYRSQSPEIKKYVVPQKISIRVHEAGTSEPISIPTNTTDTVFELRFRIFEATRILPTNQILVYRKKVLPLQKQLGECGIEDRSYIELTDHGKDITEYIIEITDAKNVRKLKSDLRKLEHDLKEAKKKSTDKLRQNEWNDASRLVNSARVLEVKKSKKVEELKEIHEKHKKGFRQLHVKIMRLFSEKRKSAAEYAKLKRDLMVAIQKNEVLRSREIVEKLMVQFIRHDGCERELMLLEAFVPDMVEAAGGGVRDDGLEDTRGENKLTPPPQDIPQYTEERVVSKPRYVEKDTPIPRGRPVYEEDRYYGQDRYRPQPTYQDQNAPQWGESYHEAQPRRQFEPQPQFISGGEGDPGAYYH